MAEVVHADVERDAAGLDGGLPHAGSEGVAGDRRAGLRGEQQVVASEVVDLDGVGDGVEPSLAGGQRAGLVVFGVGLDDVTLPGGGVSGGDCDDGVFTVTVRRKKSMWRASARSARPTASRSRSRSRQGAGTGPGRRRSEPRTRRSEHPGGGGDDLRELGVLTRVGDDQLVSQTTLVRRAWSATQTPRRPSGPGREAGGSKGAGDRWRGSSIVVVSSLSGEETGDQIRAGRARTAV